MPYKSDLEYRQESEQRQRERQLQELAERQHAVESGKAFAQYLDSERAKAERVADEGGGLGDMFRAMSQYGPTSPLATPAEGRRLAKAETEKWNRFRQGNRAHSEPHPEPTIPPAPPVSASVAQWLEAIAKLREAFERK